MKKTAVWSKHSENDLYWPRNTLYSTDTRQRRGINLDRLGLKTMTHTHCPKDAALSSALLKHGLGQSCWNSAPLQEPQQLDWLFGAAEHQDECRTDGASPDSRRRPQQPTALLFPQPLPAACLCLCLTRMTCRHRCLPVTVKTLLPQKPFGTCPLSSRSQTDLSSVRSFCTVTARPHPQPSTSSVLQLFVLS